MICQKSVFVGLTILSSFTNGNSLSCPSMGNQECKGRPQVVNVNGDEPVFFPFSFETSKCSGSCNNNKKLKNLCSWYYKKFKLQPWDKAVWNQRFKWKIIEYLMP